MNPIIYIILAILLVVILYYVYVYYTTSPILVKTVDLNIPQSNIKNIDSTHSNFMPDGSSGSTNIQSLKYTYSVWIYVDNLGKSGTEQTLFYLGNLTKPFPYFKLYLDDADTATLSVDILCAKKAKTININTNFPLQRWTNVIVSVDTNFVDIYQDGKLALSSAINKPGDAYGNIVIPDINSMIIFGSDEQTQDITLGNLMRWPYAIDPSTAYSVYLQGNGQNTSGNGVALQIWSKTGEGNSIPKTKLFG